MNEDLELIRVKILARQSDYQLLTTNYELTQCATSFMFRILSTIYGLYPRQGIEFLYSL